MRSRTRRGISPRDFVRSSLAIGCTQALSVCMAREKPSTISSFPTGPEDLTTLPVAQHVRGAYLVKDANWNTVLPQHQALLFLEYRGEIPPRESDREAVEAVFRTLERAYRRGTGGEDDAVFNNGLLYTLGYARRYFDQFERDLPDSVDLRPPKAVLSDHTQKTARARDDDFDPVILRRSEGINTSDLEPGFNFSSVQRVIDDFVETRKQMNGAEFEGTLASEKNGIVDFIEIERRATFLIPPRGRRVLPSPKPGA